MKPISLILLATLIIGCRKEDVEVKYLVQCVSCSVTYSNYTEDTEQHDAVGNGWTYTFKNPTDGQFLYISAQNNNNSGTVSVYIKINDGTRKSASSSGAYVIATASDSY